jgi:hypothetical protein
MKFFDAEANFGRGLGISLELLLEFSFRVRLSSESLGSSRSQPKLRPPVNLALDVNVGLMRSACQGFEEPPTTLNNHGNSVLEPQK